MKYQFRQSVKIRQKYLEDKSRFRTMSAEDLEKAGFGFRPTSLKPSLTLCTLALAKVQASDFKESFGGQGFRVSPCCRLCLPDPPSGGEGRLSMVNYRQLVPEPELLSCFKCDLFSLNLFSERNRH